MSQTTLEDMERNPLGWRIRDVEAVCLAHGANCVPPRGGGSHYKISRPGKNVILTIPRVIEVEGECAKCAGESVI